MPDAIRDGLRLGTIAAEIAGLRPDPFRREVHRDGRYVDLTRTQFAPCSKFSSPLKAVSSAPRNS